MELRLFCQVTTPANLMVPPGAAEKMNRLIKLATEKHGGYLNVYLRTPVRHKTQKQNNKLHAMLADIAVQIGYSAEDLKRYIKSKAVAEFGYPPALDDAGNLMRNPWGIIDGKSVSLASTEDIAKLIDCADLFAAENGIELNEEYYDEAYGV